ncbi:hypothetical protein LINPERPRIM_LOCUS40726 [Linum perenne]
MAQPAVLSSRNLLCRSSKALLLQPQGPYL